MTVESKVFGQHSDWQVIIITELRELNCSGGDGGSGDDGGSDGGIKNDDFLTFPQAEQILPVLRNDPIFTLQTGQ